MRAYEFTPSRIRLLRLPTGGDLLGDLTAYAGEHDIRSASLTFLGAVRRASIRYYDQAGQEYRDFVLERHLEVLAGTGNVSLFEGAPFVHIHAAFGDAEGRAWGGHINLGCEVFALEATLIELDGEPPVRLPDPCTGLQLWGGE